MTRDGIRDAASTLAYHWTSAESRDHQGVERMMLAFPVELQRPICALVLFFLEQRGAYTRAAAWERLLFDIAGLPPDPRQNLDLQEESASDQTAYIELARAEQERHD
jgi:hypothetical protein